MTAVADVEQGLDGRMPGCWTDQADPGTSGAPASCSCAGPGRPTWRRPLGDAASTRRPIPTNSPGGTTT